MPPPPPPKPRSPPSGSRSSSTSAPNTGSRGRSSPESPKNECDFAHDPDPSCTPQPGATGPGQANYAGASGPMQIGVGGAAGDEYQSLQQYLPDPQLGPHDPTTAVELAALVLIKHKGAPQGAPIDAYLPYVTAYNGTGPQAQAYGQQVLADAHAYQGTGTTTMVSAGCAARAAAGAYANPLAGAPYVVAERIDMGVDYADPNPEPDRRGRRRHHHLRRPPRRRLATQLRQLHPRPAARTHRAIRVPVRAHHPHRPSRPDHPTRTADRHLHPRRRNRNRIRRRTRHPVSTRAAQLNQQAQTGDAGNNRTYCGQAMSNLIQQAGGPPGLTEGHPVVGTGC